MIVDEVYNLSRHGKLGSINEVRKLPTYLRRYYLYRLSDEYEKQKEEMEKAQRRQNTGVGFSKKPRRR